MFKLTKIVLPILFILAFSGEAYASSSLCPAVAPPVEVYVKTRASDIQLNNSRSSASLGTEDIDSSILSRHHGSYEVGGLARGDIDMSQEIVFGTRSDVVTGEKCVWVDKVTINVDVDHTIFVARKFKPGSCMFRETYNHEIKHVNVDRQVVNKFVGQIRYQAKRVSSTLGLHRLSGSDNIGTLKKQLSEKIQAAVNPVVGRMQQERRIRQDQVDTEEEYRRVQDACKARY